MTALVPGRREALRAGMAGLLLAVPGVARAQTVTAGAYPSRLVRIIVPFAPGAATDIFARLTAQRITEAMGGQVVVENRTGAGGNIGADAVAKAPKDGYTLLFSAMGPTAVNPAVYPNMPFDALNDFAPVTQFARVPMLLVVHPSMPVQSVEDLLRLAREQPGGLNCASGAGATSQRLAAVLFESMAGVRFEHVTYRSFALAVPDLLAGRVPVSFGDPASLLPSIRSGALRAIAVTTAQRFPQMPEVPTIAEVGVPGYAAEAWYGLFSPAGTDTAIIDRLAREIAAGLRLPEVAARVRDLGGEPVGSSPEAFATFVRAEHDRWGRLARAANLRAD